MSLKKKRKSQTLSMQPFLITTLSLKMPEKGENEVKNSKKNGFHKLSINTTNGKQRIDFFEQEPSSPDSGCEPDFNFCRERDALIQTLEKDPKNLEAVSIFVKQFKNMLSPCKNSDCCLRLCDLSGTDYMGQDYMQEAWEEFYLPKKTRMQVFGTLECTQGELRSVPCVILVGEDGCVYAYGDEEMQLISKSLNEFVENGNRKVYESYYDPDSSDEEDQAPQQDEEILKIRHKGREFVNKSSKQFGDFLDFLSS